MANENLTELHFFGIPTAYFDIFPKGVQVAIRKVHAMVEFCVLFPNVLDFSLRRIAASEFAVILSSGVAVAREELVTLATGLVALNFASFPVSLLVVAESGAAVGHTTVSRESAGTIVAQHTSQEDAETRMTQHESSDTQLEIEVDIV